MPGLLPNDLIVTGCAIDKLDRIWLARLKGLHILILLVVPVTGLRFQAACLQRKLQQYFCDSKGILWVGSRGAGISNAVKGFIKISLA